MTDTRTVERRELEEALGASGATPDQANKIAEALEKERGVKSWKSFYVYFKKFNLKEFFDEQIAWKKEAEIFVALDQAWDAYADKVKAEEVAKQELKDADETKPIDPDTNKSLTKTWKERYAFNLHPTQEFTAQLLNGMYRKLQRRQGQAKPVRGLYTLEDRANMGEAKQRKRLFNNDFDLIDKSKPLDEDNPNYIANKSPFLFLIALEAMLRTFVKAGSYLVEDPDKPDGHQDKMVLNVDREPIEEHLANVRSFILTWYLKTKRPTDDKIIRQVARLDMNIRRKWWRSYRDDSEGKKTFTACILEHKAYADQQWDGDYEIQMYPPWEKTKPEKGESKGSWKGKGASKGAAAKGAAARGVASPQGSRNNINTISVWCGDKRVKAARSRGSERFCAEWNAKGTCSRTNCTEVHKCNILTSPTKVCGHTAHAGCAHTGRTVD